MADMSPAAKAERKAWLNLEVAAGWTERAFRLEPREVQLYMAHESRAHFAAKAAERALWEESWFAY